MFKRLSLSHVAIAVLFAELALVIYRMTLGIDFSDESYYVALPLRFALGDRPFVDDLTFLQPAALIVTPLIWIYYKLIGSTYGIVLFTRLAYTACTLALASFLFLCLKQNSSKALCAFVAGIAVLFVPYNIPNFSYNTIGSMFLSLGLFSLAFNPRNLSNVRRCFLSGIFFGLSACAYPPFAIAAGVAFLVHLALRRRNLSVPASLAGFAVPVLFFGTWFWLVGRQNIAAVLGLLNSYGAYGVSASEKFQMIADMFSYNMPPLWILAGWFLLGIGSRNRWVTTATMGLYFATIILGHNFSYSSSGIGIITYCFLFAIPWVIRFRRRSTFEECLLIGLPAAAAGGAAAWGSSNAFLAAGLGFFPGLLVGIWHLSQDSDSEQEGILVQPLPALFHVYFLCSFFLWNSFYKEYALPELTSRVKSGAFAGLKTSPDKSALLERLSRLDTGYCGRDTKVIYYHPFVAGYLLTSHRPALPCLWASPKVSEYLLDKWPTKGGAMLLRIYQFEEQNDALDEMSLATKRNRVNEDYEISCL